MGQNSCPQCQRRLPYASRRCLHCGWMLGATVDPGVARGVARRRNTVWFVVAAALVAGGSVAALRAPLVSDWYADFAAQHLPEPLSSFAITPTYVGAFFYCARQVAREMDGEFSVETFSSPAESESEYLGDGRYRITAQVDEARADGSTVTHEFSCTARLEAGRWMLEELVLQ